MSRLCKPARATFGSNMHVIFAFASSDLLTYFCHWSYYSCCLDVFRLKGLTLAANSCRYGECCLTSQIREFPAVSIVTSCLPGTLSLIRYCQRRGWPEFSNVKRRIIGVSYYEEHATKKFLTEIEVRFSRAMTGYRTRMRKTRSRCN